MSKIEQPVSVGQVEERVRIRSRPTFVFPSKKSWLMEVPALDLQSNDTEAPEQRGHCDASFTF